MLNVRTRDPSPGIHAPDPGEMTSAGRPMTRVVRAGADRRDGLSHVPGHS